MTTHIKIEDVGLKAYLDMTADRHNGCKYKDFVTMLPDISKRKIAARFGVTEPTVYSWIRLLRDSGRDRSLIS